VACRSRWKSIKAGGATSPADAARLFGHWQNIANGERMNYWLSVLAENALLLDELRRRF